jgi:hypothetical protein
VIIVGAARSGTNMLRDQLAQLPGLITWPCDEINYVWRHGHREFATDEFTRSMATPETVAYIRRQFHKLDPGGDQTIIEKTCATTLRCGFVHEVFPNARFVHIIRDGRDVAASASLRWNAKLDLGYIWKKARYVPPSDIPYYAFSYLKARLYRILSGKKRLSTWGPRFEGMDAAFSDHPLPVGCAIQWAACVRAARQQLNEVNPEQVLTVRYEQFTADPNKGLKEVCEFLGVDVDPKLIEPIVSRVSSKSVGKWKQQLTEEQSAAIQREVGDLLSELEYQ